MKTKTDLRAGKLVGDAVERFTKATGLDALAEKYTDQTGKDCGCDKRHEILDRVFPF